MGKKRMILGIFLTAAFLASVGMELRRQMQYRENAADYADAVQIAGLSKIQGEKPVETPDAPEASAPLEADTPPADPAEALADVDLDALRAVNADVVGWIAIPDTEISYPLLQAADNRYYLKHSWKGESNKGGAVFLEASCRSDFSGYHTIVYGHRMQNGTMFGSLKYYEDISYWREHPSVYVRTDSGVWRYDIFAAHEASVKGIVYRLDMEESGLTDEFLTTCLEQSVIETGIVPEHDAPVLTLSTCTSTGYAKRWVVQAVLGGVYQEE